MIKDHIRVKRHYLNKRIVGFIVKHVALRLARLSNMNNCEYRREIEIVYYPNGIDSYTSCKSPNKEYCGKKRNHYVATLGAHSYYGNTLSHMYCNMIAGILLDTPQFPFCTYKPFPPKIRVLYAVRRDIGNMHCNIPTDKHFRIKGEM